MLTPQDYNAFVAGYQSCGPSRSRFDEGWFNTDFMTEAWFLQLLQRRRKEAETDFCYMLDLFRKSDGRCIGYCDITPHRREDFQYARIGYTLHNPYWGRGYAAECVKAMVTIGFEQLNLHRLEAHVNLDNDASKKVLLKAGFAFECVRKGFILEDGVWTDNEIYYRNNPDWKPAPEGWAPFTAK